MAFNPETLGVIVQPIGGEGIRFVSYRSDDGSGTITLPNYFKGAQSFGLRKFDLVFVSPVFLTFDPYIVVIVSINVAGDGTAVVQDLVLPGSIGLNELDASVVSVLQSALQPADIGVTVQAFDTNLDTIAGLSDVSNLTAVANGDVGTTGLALLGDETAGDALTTLGVSAYIQTLLNDADASTAQTTLGISTFVKTILNDADAAAVLTTLGIPYTSGSYTPAVTAGTGTITTLGTRTATWARIADLCYITIDAVITTNGTGATSLIFGLPFTATAPGMLAGGIVNSGAGAQGFITISTTLATVFTSTGTYPGADARTIRISGVYKV